MARAKQLPSGNWRALVYAGKDENGKRQYKSFTAPTERKAELAALEWQEHYKEISRDSSNMTVEEAIDAYIKLKGNILSPCTLRCYNSIKNNHLGNLKKLKLNKLTQNNIQETINKEAEKLSPKTVRNIYGLLTAIINQYRPDWEIPKITLPQPKKSNAKALTKQEISLLLKKIEGDRMEIPILLALWLGLRRSEIVALKWEDIDFENNTISINKAMVPDMESKMVEKSTKTTESTRILNLPPYIKEKLLALPRDEERIVNINANSISMRFPKLCEEIGINKYKFHDLRRSMATVGLSLNIADKIMMSRGGWSNPQTMKNIYQVVLQNDLSTADMMINNYFESLISNSVQHDMQHDFKNK